MPKHIDMGIAYQKEEPGGGWRMVKRGGTGPDRFKNPQADKLDTIRWHAPKDHDLCIVMLDDSPFARKGTPIVDEVIDIPKGSESKRYEIDPAENDRRYEYAALVKKGDGDYVYVRGEKSPPGVVVGKPPPEDP